MGYLTGELPGPYKSIGRMQIKWYQFIRPDGVEFNFDAGQDPYSADSQGRVGVPGYGSTDYIEQSIALIDKYSLLYEEGIIICESNDINKMIYPKEYKVVKSKKYGDKYIEIISKM